ncbi:MAG: hypothetical protein IAF38_13280 [Bacteroidia bacterium]|nr:hypothetical protein [Bacteroidia bacterium]
MKIGKNFNALTLKEYFLFIDNYKKYTDFNTLGLYRSITENKKLELEQKIELREYANKTFRKTFDFLQLKDPGTYFDVITLGQALTDADKDKIWKDIRNNQQKILTDKKIKHRSFGVYSKHVCGYDKCPYEGVMFKKGSFFLDREMHFKSDKNRHGIQRKAERSKKERKKRNYVFEE